MVYALVEREGQSRAFNLEARKKMGAPGTNWCVGVTQVGREFKAQSAIEELGIPAYLPLRCRFRKVNRYKRQKTKFAYPAMAGYIFLGLPSGFSDWFGLSEIEDLDSLLGRVDGNALSGFLVRNAGYFDAPDEQQWMVSNQEFGVGDKAKIASGPFEGHIILVEGFEGNRACFELDILGARKQTTIGVDQLLPAD